MSTVPINPTSIKKYLDKCIRFWRNKLKNSKTKKEKLIAKCYIDAFQSVRISILGELLCYPQTIKTVVLSYNQFLIVSDEFKEQIPKYQGKLEEKYELILNDSTDDTKFYVAFRGLGGEISKEDFKHYVIEVIKHKQKGKEEK